MAAGTSPASQPVPSEPDGELAIRRDFDVNINIVARGLNGLCEKDDWLPALHRVRAKFDDVCDWLDAERRRCAALEAEVAGLRGVLAEKGELIRRLAEGLSAEGKAEIAIRAIWGDNPIDRPSIEAPSDTPDSSDDATARPGGDALSGEE